MVAKKRLLSLPHDCVYLPEQTAQMEYEATTNLNIDYYSDMINQHWRRFGTTFFRPRCPSCRACEPIRVIVSKFKPNRSQKRTMNKLMQNGAWISVGEPHITPEKIDLYERHHLHHHEQKGWPFPNSWSIQSHLEVFSQLPYPTEEWSFYLKDKLYAVCYVDGLRDGLSGLYFYYDPDMRDMSPGTGIILAIIQQAVYRKLPYVYLGYLVKGCRSMEYKANFKPYEILGQDGVWREHEEDGKHSTTESD
jgi:leucyl-tRNA---protein transferase